MKLSDERFNRQSFPFLFNLNDDFQFALTVRNAIFPDLLRCRWLDAAIPFLLRFFPLLGLSAQLSNFQHQLP